jgi:ADP-ribose pyrophosphatase YjhB (NUDIX family)
VLLVRHTNDGKWVMPGGIVEPDEHPARRVVEEMLEETGLRVEPLRLLGVHGGPACRVTYSNGDLVSYVVTAYECRVVSGTPTPNGEETLEVRYVAEDEIATLDLSTIGHANVRVAFGDIGVFDTAS